MGVSFNYKIKLKNKTKEELLKQYKLLLNNLPSFVERNFTPDKVSNLEKTDNYMFSLIIPVKDEKGSVMKCGTIFIILHHDENIIRLDTDLEDPYYFKGDLKENRKLIIELTKYFIENLDIEFITAGIDPENDKTTGMIEFRNDPYEFCVENPDENNDLEEFKKIITKEELIKIIKENSDFCFISKNGVGVYRSKENENYPRGYIYPRYFIRKDLRKRGLKLKDGLAEIYAKESKIE